MEARTKINPWLGLESYKEGEVLYGRDEDIRDLVQCVLNDVDTLLYGKSGIGKSSILNAGILPAARRNGYLPILIRLSHNNSDDYLYQIKAAILASMHIVADDKESINNRIKEVVACNNNRESFYEFFHRHTFHDSIGKRIKLLIIFDQFEEIFTLQSDESKKKEFFAQMADILNDIMPAELHHTIVKHSDNKELIESDATNSDQLFDEIDLDFKANLPEYVNDNEIHFVFTIREDFLSEFEYFSASIPSLKQNRYGLRPINEEQAAQIILRPEPGLIDLTVAKLIIEHVTGRTDFILDGIPEIEVDAAVLSIFLNRLYTKKDKNVHNISSDLVNAYSGNIIKDFYLESIDSNCSIDEQISETSIIILEDHLLTREGRRNNVSRNDLLSLGISNRELDLLIDKRKLLRQFSHGNDLRIEFIHDILCPIVKERREQRKIISEQESERNRREEENQKLLQEREKERTIRNIEYNQKKRAIERNVLIHKGRRLIDNAYDFGEFRTINNIPLRNPVDKIMAFVRLMTRAYEDYFENLFESEFVNQQVFCDPLLENAGIVLSFYKDDESVPTIDGVYGIELKYEGALISDILFKQ